MGSLKRIAMSLSSQAILLAQYPSSDQDMPLRVPSQVPPTVKICFCFYIKLCGERAFEFARGQHDGIPPTFILDSLPGLVSTFRTVFGSAPFAGLQKVPGRVNGPIWIRSLRN